MRCDARWKDSRSESDDLGRSVGSTHGDVAPLAHTVSREARHHPPSTTAHDGEHGPQISREIPPAPGSSSRKSIYTEKVQM